MEAPNWPCLNLETKEGGADRALGWENTTEYQDCRLNCEIKNKYWKRLLANHFHIAAKKTTLRSTLTQKIYFKLKSTKSSKTAKS